MFENAKDDVDFLNKTGDKLVHNVDHHLVNSAPVQDQLAALNASYKELFYKLEAEELKLEQVRGAFSCAMIQLSLLLSGNKSSNKTCLIGK